MVQDASGFGSMLKSVPNDAKSKGIQTKRSDAVKNCVKLIAFVAIIVLVLHNGAQQLQASKIPTELINNQHSCCLEHVGGGIGNGTLFINSIDRHDRGTNDGPSITNAHTYVGEKADQLKQESGQNVTTDEIDPIRSDTAIKYENRLLKENSKDKAIDTNSDLATMASNGVVLVPEMIKNRLTLGQLATIHENLESFVERPTIKYPISQLDQLAGSSDNLPIDAQDRAIKHDDVGVASASQPSLAEPIVAGTNAQQNLVSAQANNNYGQADLSGEDNDDDNLSPDFNKHTGVAQNQDRADSEEEGNNAAAQKHQLNPLMQSVNGATSVYEGSAPRHVDVGSLLSQEQSIESPDKTATHNDDDSMMSEQMPDSIESLMRSGSETEPLDIDGSNDESSAADEPVGDSNQQLSAGGNNYAQNVELPDIMTKDILLGRNAAAYQVPVSLQGGGGVNNLGVAPIRNVNNDDDDDRDNDEDDGENKNSNVISSSPMAAALNQQVSFSDNRLPEQLGSSDHQLMRDSSYNEPTHDHLQTAAGHHYKKKKKKIKKVKKVKIIKKNKKKKYKVVKYKKEKKGKMPMDHGKYYMYAKVPKKKSWEFGFKKGNKKHWISRHEKGHKNKFKTKVKWYDKKSKGKGVHIWDYNHHDKKKKHYG